MVGSEVVTGARESGWVVVGLSHADLDVADRPAVRRAVASARPNLVLNAAAYTRVDAAESHVDAARRANADGPRWLAEACAAGGIPLVQVSTDYVFDGGARSPYRPDDRANPLGVYGRTKWEGERAVRQGLDQHLIVRTSWVFAPHGRNFLCTIARLAREQDTIAVVVDQRGSPTLASDLARALLAAGAALLAGRPVAGTYHFCNAGETTWHGFASAIVEGLRAREPVRCRSVVPISTQDYAAAAPRPAYAVLDTSSWRDTFGVAPRPWREALAEALGGI